MDTVAIYDVFCCLSTHFSSNYCKYNRCSSKFKVQISRVTGCTSSASCFVFIHYLRTSPVMEYKLLFEK